MPRNRREAEEAAERLLPIGNNTIARGAVVDMVRRGDSHRERIIDRVWQVFGSMEPAGAGQEVGHVRSFSSSAKFYFSISLLIVETNYLIRSHVVLWHQN